MRRIPNAAWEQVVQHCHDVAPEEAVGYLAAVRGDEHTITDVVRVLNVTEFAHARYEVDEREQLAVWAALEQRGKRVVITYHSHVNAPAVLSETDVAMARDPGMLHLVVSLVDGLGVADADLFRVEYTAGVPAVARVPFEVVGQPGGGAMFMASGL